MSFVTAKEPLEQNIATLNPVRDAALYNVSVAMLEIAKGLQKLSRDLDDVSTRVKRLDR